MEKLSKKREFKKFKRTMFAYISIGLLASSLVFTSSDITGHSIASTSQLSNTIGVILFLGGLVFAYVHLRYENFKVRRNSRKIKKSS